MQIKKYETKDRYGNSKSFEFFEGLADMDIPGMTDMPDHPGEPKGTDTVPAWLTPGEFVINKEATDMYGPLLKNINDEGRKMQNGEPHNHPSEAMYAADGNVVGTPFKRPASLKNMKTSTDWIDDNLLDNLKLIESGGKHFKDDGTLVTSPAGALGAYQWMPESAKDPGYGIEAFDPTTISEAGMRAKSKEYLEQIQRHNPTWSKDQVLRAYNFGPKASSDGRNIPKETFEYPYKVLQGTQSPDYSEFTIENYRDINLPNSPIKRPEKEIDSAGAMAGDETMYPAITQETLSKPIRSVKEIDKDIATLEAQNSAQEVATEDPSFLDRAGNFISDAVSGYRDLRKDYRKRYIDYYNADKGYFDSIYRQAGGSVPQYYAVGDEVRDYYRSGIPMPGSAPTYNYSNAPTFETMADTIKDKLEKEEAERLRKAQEERFGAVDKLSMDRLQTMKNAEKIDALKRERAEALQVAYNNSSAREDAFNKNYYTGVPGDVPSADEFSSIPQDYYDERNGNYDKPRRPSTYTEKQGASLFDLVENPDSTGDGYMIPELELVDKRKVPANTGYSGAEYQDPRIPSPMNTSIPSADEYSNTDSAKQMQSDIKEEDYLNALQREEGSEERRDFNTIPDKSLSKEEIQKLVKEKYQEVGLGNYKPLIPESFAKSWGQHFNNVGMKDLNDVVESKNRRVVEAKNDLIKAIQKGAPQKQIDMLKQRWKEATQGAALASDTAIVTERYQDKYRIDKQLEEAKLTQEQSLIKLERLKNAGLLEEAEKERLALIENEKLIKELEIQENNAAELFDTSFTGVTKSGKAVTEGISTVINGDPDVTAVDSGGVDSNTSEETGAITSRLDGLDDGSAEGFDVNTVEQKGNAELGLGESFNLDGVVKKALENKNPKFVKTKAFLSKYFGNLFDTEELARMAVLYLGSRAMGASHNGSLAWSGKYYLKRMENKDASHAENVEKAIAAKLYTPASIEKYKKSRNLSDLKSIKTGSSYALKGDRKEFYNPKLNKRDMAIKVEMTGADGVKQQYYTLNPYDKNKPGYMQPMNMDWTTDDSRVKGSKGYSSLLKTNTDLIEGQLDEWIKNDVKDGTHPATRLTAGSKTMAGQTAEWAMSYGFDAANLGSVSKIAYENMISYMRAYPKKKPGDIKVFLDAALVRQTANRGGNLFDPLDGKTPNDDRIKALNEQFMKSGKSPISTWKTFEGRSQLDLKYKNAIALFNQDMLDNPEYINKTVTNNTKPGESIFMAWLRRELSGLGPTPTKKSTK